MTSVFEGNISLPCTIIETFSCFVTQQKTEATDGYYAVQLACDEQKRSRVSKPLQGHFDKAGVPPQQKVVEFRFFDSSADEASWELGRAVSQEDMFHLHDCINVQAVTKGKGFAGVMERHNFSGLDEGHGQHNRQRHPGSIGAGTNPGRVFPGKKMAGRKGGERVTVSGLKVLKMINDPNGRRLIVLKGPVPGPRGGYVILKKQRVS